MIYIILLLVSVVLGVLAQLSLKEGMVRAGIDSLFKDFWGNLKKIYLNVFVIFGFLAYGATTLLWIVILNNLELSFAYPFVALNYFFVALMSKFVFKEHISVQRWASIGIILLGVIMVGLS